MGQSGHEYADVLGDHPEFVAEIVASFPLCYLLTELSVIRHEPDNGFLEWALAADAEFIITVNTARGHFDRKQYQAVSVARPTEFLNVPEVARLVRKLTESELTRRSGDDCAGARAPFRGNYRSDKFMTTANSYAVSTFRAEPRRTLLLAPPAPARCETAVHG